MGSPSSTSLLHALKIALLSAAVLLLAVLLAPHLPNLFSSLRSFLRPPYLYVLINCIILTIAASSRLHHHFTTPHPLPHPHQDAFQFIHSPDLFSSTEISPVPVSGFDFSQPEVVSYTETMTFRADREANLPNHEPETLQSEVKSRNYEPETVRSEANSPNYEPDTANSVNCVEERPLINEIAASVEQIRSTEAAELASRRRLTPTLPPLARQETFDVVSSFFQTQYKEKTTVTPPVLPPLARQETSEMVSSFFQTQLEKPPPSARFGHHRRPSKSAQEGGKALRVAKPKKTETLESTWKTITEGRQLPLTRHLKKSDTFENSNRREVNSSDPASAMANSPVKKSETFTDRTNFTAAVAAEKLKKDPSLSQEELNRRVEAFIKKVNSDMKLQRQESAQQFMEMINRASC